MSDSAVAHNVPGALNQDGWRVSVSKEWDVLGPFPIQAREQHFLSPSYPLNLSQPLDLDTSYPSAYADGGNVGWGHATSGDDGVLGLSYPNIRWSALRAFEGWAALQHHSVLRTRITVYPPREPASVTTLPHLLVELLQGSFFTVLPEGDAALGTVPKWYAGNIYALDAAPPHAVSLPVPPSQTSPTSYDLFVSGDYEIRLFGDPAFRGDGVPVLSVTLNVVIEDEPDEGHVARIDSHDVSCDFVDGWAFGDALGVGLRSVSSWWTVESVSLARDLADIQVDLVRPTRLAPTQARIVPIRLVQSGPFYDSEIHVLLHLVSDAARITLPVTLPAIQHPQWTASSFPPSGIKASYFHALAVPTAFLVIPPKAENTDEPRPVVLALHGSGVEIFDAPFWVEAHRRQQRSWILLPSGRTSWGLDWHGPSVQNEWDSVDALYAVLNGREAWHPWAIAEHSRVLVLGHSNGGQGTWYLAARYPDRVVAAIPAAAFTKMQAYIPLTQSRAAHFIDPALRAILESSFTPDDNNLFLSNVADMPILAIHGGNDENVPTWHTRAYVDALKTWNPEANVTYREDPGELHWYPTVFANDHVQGFMRSILEQNSGVQQIATSSLQRSFTLTVAIPSESGSLYGWRIHSLRVPGRLARLVVDAKHGMIEARTTNVRMFSIARSALQQDVQFKIDGSDVYPHVTNTDASEQVHFLLEAGTWKPLSDATDIAIQPSGRMSAVLTSAAPLTIVTPSLAHGNVLSAATRLAHVLDVYHKLDAEIIDDAEAVRRHDDGWLGQGNIVILECGGAKGTLFRSLINRSQTAFALRDDMLHLEGKAVNRPGGAALFLHPHPSSSSALILVIYAVDQAGLEKGVRLFPIRTGVASPDWMVLGDRTDMLGAGGLEGAGVWGNDWKWNEAMSSL